MATTWSKESQTKAAATGSTADTSFQLDSSQSFLIKNSSASNIFTFAESTGDLTVTGDITVSGNNLVCNTLTAATSLNLNSGTGSTGNDSITNVLDTGGGSTSYFKVQKFGEGGNTDLLAIGEGGDGTFGRNLTVTGQFACNGQSVSSAPDYASTSYSTNRTITGSTSAADTTDVLATLISDLISIGLLT